MVGREPAAATPTGGFGSGTRCARGRRLELGYDPDGIGAPAVLRDGRVVTGSEFLSAKVLVWDPMCG